MLKQLSKIREQFAPLNTVRAQRQDAERAAKAARQREREAAERAAFQERLDAHNAAVNDIAGLVAQETKIRDEAVGLVGRIERDVTEVGELLARIERRDALDEQDTALDKLDNDRIKALRADRPKLKARILELAKARERLHSQIELAEAEERKRRQGL